ncbi:MAG TPA: 16S rRNA (guanine(527)-N(7))-methyltransferase RsmG [Micropepsaceae bacterium]|nr:16S rRNA (guanine(527)-N(7))-methyltransferase RsmG [Micropepsaceae bacterium]
MPPAEDGFGPDEFAALCGVSRETLLRLKAYAGMLVEWNTRQNLVSQASLAHLWRRHFWDSAQLVPLLPPGARSLVDLGSGAGFPGLVLAELLRDRPDFSITLYEATQKKCRFLEAVAKKLGLNPEIRCMRIEEAPEEAFDVITARACKPLPELLAYAQRFWAPHTVGLFLKGQNVGLQLTEARKSWRMEVQRHPSRSDPAGVILELRELRGVRKPSPSKR